MNWHVAAVNAACLFTVLMSAPPPFTSKLDHPNSAAAAAAAASAAAPPCSLTGGNFDAAAMATSRYLPVESAMPGTTLGLIPLQAFETGGTLYGESRAAADLVWPDLGTPPGVMAAVAVTVF
jgi:hypothetical protein